MRRVVTIGAANAGARGVHIAVRSVIYVKTFGASMSYELTEKETQIAGGRYSCNSF